MEGRVAEIDNGDILRIGATWQFEGAYEVTNVWHAKVVAGGGITYAAGALDVQDYMADIYVQIEPRLSSSMLTDFLTLSNVTQDTTFGAIAWQGLIQGDVVSQVTAPGVTLFAWARTLKPRVQIRKYFGVFTEDDMVDGVWSGAVRAVADAAMVVHVQDYVGGPALTLRGVAFNRTLLTHVEAISVSTSAEPAYQRRRKRGRGS